MADACARVGRSPDDVRLLTVTKTVPHNVLRHAHKVGITSFSENKVQEARSKLAALSDLDVTWNIIGHLQSNKAKYVAQFADEFHALDSLNLASELNKHLVKVNRFMDVFIQVNTSGEPSKYGVQPDELSDLVKGVSEFPRLRPKGLMTLAILSPDYVKIRECFKLLSRLRDSSEKIDSRFAGLSMGMSGDFEIAIEEGATVVRVGESIFGKRPISAGPFWPESKI
jgi:pyridoxal phosphate enzyme (YggS family)